ncbi:MULTISPECIES: glutathione S-transferase family protein [unclassified Mesorhizobium]|uniref:glutathione S-transferase family protein n=1 Tax=unclassified Mesorhizobium TaxID=325217 RepID=UPI000F7505ED|nr:MULTISPECIES: glutathione S-transferase family protein [unclassified Mesorhizobium]TGT53336.1 glutathione S-transferase family protein [Mesorhizobium sp. M00.F.Ca.ET.170.01.1.1]AZO11769.1 glutathione S-transferase family protein [Mesorhizobium sp. M3A.F.Ca.ET.080.04.2.1]RWB72594.1 MAG: glutathione S-transferase family protein [Mesorhizobium sp.]RWB87135.1 MAG: glutathione S-transferase family protein [Mesorhizobium sp.]RWE25625.1 MAG: glutathione S-transferase family protein [Mesorhizobium 
MGLLVEGKWTDRAPSVDSGGRFVRAEAQWRDWVTRDGAPAEGRKQGFKAEPGRYHLYVSLACPWAHRTLIFRALKKLEGIISVSVVHHFMGENGWTFKAEDGATGDTLYGLDYLHQIYVKANPAYSGRVTVPVLWDKSQETIVSNESSEIIRMLNSAFDDWGDASRDFYPKALRSEIDRINALVYPAINNGVYRTGFATTQEAYEEAFGELFGALDMVEERLSKQRYLVGDRLTEADWRLFTTLVRFDPVYVGHFKCNLRRIADYPNLSNYLRDLYQVRGVSATVNLHHIKSHYYGSHKSINPTGIIPLGPELDYAAPHDRGRFRKAA